MDDKANSKWATWIFGGIISIVVGIASGYGVNWLTEKKAELSYDITSIQAFPGQERIGIVAVRVINSGKKELENIDAGFRFPDAEIKEIQFQGLNPQTLSKDKTSLRFQLPFLNASESFLVQVLVSPNSESLQRPIVDLRAKGAIGIPFQPDEIEKIDKQHVLALSVSAFVPFLTLYLFRKRSGFSIDPLISTGHFDDQRDIFAFILGAYGFIDDAEGIKKWPRELSYWSISDMLTEKWLNSGDNQKLISGREILNQLIEYAKIADESKRILLVNLARLSMALNDRKSAIEYITKAASDKRKIVKDRIKIHKELAGLVESA